MSRLMLVTLLMVTVGCARPAPAPSAPSAPPAPPAPSGPITEDGAVAFVEKLGRQVIRDEGAPGKPVIGLNLGVTNVTDAGLKELSAFKNLKYLYLYGTNVTDAGLKELSALKNLTTLYLSRTQLTDAGIMELQKALPKCKISKF